MRFLRIEWTNPESDHFIDMLSISDLGADNKRVTHYIERPNTGRFFTSAAVRREDNAYFLTYDQESGDKVWHGITKLVCPNGKIDDQIEVFWKSKGKKKYEDLKPLFNIVDDVGIEEGSSKVRVHLARERSSFIVNLKKRSALSLSCEVCSFNFEDVYGELGSGFCEVHHLKRLSDGEAKTSLEKLAILCANCHRMIHRGNSILTIQELRQVYADKHRRVE